MRVLFTGRSSILFTDDDGANYKVRAETLELGSHDRLLFSREIKKFGVDKYLSEEERKMIVSKILSLTKTTKWLVLG